MSASQNSTSNQDEKKYTKDFQEVQRNELDEIFVRRKLMSPFIRGKEINDINKDNIKNDLVGLSLSGGGIRSATFNLGIIQAFYRAGLLQKVDYLSTVSGGGYIGSCLTSLLNSKFIIPKTKEHKTSKGEGPISFTNDEKKVILKCWEKENFPFELNSTNESLKELEIEKETDNSGKDSGSKYEKAGDKEPVKWLRFFSNYLTVEGGYLKILIMYLRGLVLNTLKILPYILALSLFFYLIFNFEFLLGKTESYFDENNILNTLNFGLKTLLISIIVLSLVWAGGNKFGFFKKDFNRRKKFNQLFLILILIIFSFVLLSLFKLFIYDYDDNEKWYWLGLLCLLLLPLLLNILIKNFINVFNAKKFLITFSSIAFLSLAPIAIIFVVSSFIITLSQPGTLNKAKGQGKTIDSTFVPTKTSGSNALSARIISPDSIENKNTLTFSQDTTKVKESEYPVKPASSDDENEELLKKSTRILRPAINFIYQSIDSLFGTKITKDLSISIKLLILMVFLWFLTDQFININNISLHKFYRDSLSKAYMIQDSFNNKNLFSQLNHIDHQRLSELYNLKDNNGILTSVGPYHILNATLNLSKKLPKNYSDRAENTGTKNKLLRSLTSTKFKDILDDGIFRSGESFIFSKHWSGSRKTGYISTKELEFQDTNIDLATAVAISGGALNVSMAEETINNFRFLFSMFNIRLGYWILNPFNLSEEVLKNSRNKFYVIFRKYFAGWTIFFEWLGRYKMDDMYINLSDGGHFENLGAYELLKRKCKYLIISDCEADPQMRFKGLSYLIRLARIDLGIKVEINLADIQPKENKGYSNSHGAVGRIVYPDGNTGYLLYIKSSLTGDEPPHLNEYKIKNPCFPHQTTADQWFDEQQFEVYRELGYHIGKEMLKPINKNSDLELEDDFIGLREYWFHHSDKDGKDPSERFGDLANLYQKLQKDNDLEFLDSQFYPHWNSLSPEASTDKWIPSDKIKLRKGFFTCNMMIQLMEKVYVDLDLEKQFSHPDNRGWMNQFRSWSQSNMFRLAWAISAGKYGARFQTFCEKRFGLSFINMAEVNEENKLFSKIMINFNESSDKEKVREELKKMLSVNTDNGKFIKLNSVEYEIINNNIIQNDIFFRDIVNFSFSVSNALGNTSEVEKQEVKFYYAFALINNKDEIVFFRVQNQMRKMGFGRKALLIMNYASKINWNGNINSEAIKKLEKIGYCNIGLDNYHRHIPRFRRLVDSVISEGK